MLRSDFRNGANKEFKNFAVSYVAVPDDFKILGNNYQSDIKHKISESL